MPERGVVKYKHNSAGEGSAGKGGRSPPKEGALTSATSSAAREVSKSNVQQERGKNERLPSQPFERDSTKTGIRRER